MNFDGEILSHWSRRLEFPHPAEVIRDVAEFGSTHLSRLPSEQREGFLGTGIAMPWFIGEWREELGIAGNPAAEWDGALASDPLCAGACREPCQHRTDQRVMQALLHR
jgi:hypothetical protein